jgi:hypothetical protein
MEHEPEEVIQFDEKYLWNMTQEDGGDVFQ